MFEKWSKIGRPVVCAWIYHQSYFYTYKYTFMSDNTLRLNTVDHLIARTHSHAQIHRHNTLAQALAISLRAQLPLLLAVTRLAVRRGVKKSFCYDLTISCEPP